VKGVEMNYDTELQSIEKQLPKYLEDDIKAFVICQEKTPIKLCLYWEELYGSINTAYYDNYISEAEADNLRRKYLF
jgi:hypothetical protein